ncbi:hypothetical protein CCMA1212_010713 [Trichoderma ghanense]|uniref:Uncharacterized protein n=1 Tax=Trichoderma ghanense TaxID=65468 RepID=A0ABY2GQE1_9HYPO
MHEHHWEWHESSDEYSMTRVRRTGDGFPPCGEDPWYPSGCGQPTAIIVDGAPPGAPPAPPPGGSGPLGPPAPPGTPGPPGPPAPPAATAAGSLLATVNIYSPTPPAPVPPPPPPPPECSRFCLRVLEREFRWGRENKNTFELDIGPRATIQNIMRAFDSIYQGRYNVEVLVVWRGSNGGCEPLSARLTPEQLRDNASYLKVSLTPMIERPFILRR